MPGPRNAADALRWIQVAVQQGRYHPSAHFYDRMAEEPLAFDDILWTIEQPFVCETYDRPPKHGGTCWRIKGRNVLNTRNVWVGCEAYLDAKKHRCILCTAFDPDSDKKG